MQAQTNVHVLSLLQAEICSRRQTRFIIGFPSLLAECDPLHAQCFRKFTSMTFYFTYHAPKVLAEITRVSDITSLTLTNKLLLKHFCTDKITKIVLSVGSDELLYKMNMWSAEARFCLKQKLEKYQYSSVLSLIILQNWSSLYEWKIPYFPLSNSFNLRRVWTKYDQFHILYT